MLYNQHYLFLIATILVIPILIYALKYIKRCDFSKPQRDTLGNWIFFLIVIVALRALVGMYLIINNSELYGVSAFYPIRIAHPNYNFLKGVVYLLPFGLIVCFLPKISSMVFKGKFKTLKIWLSSVIVLLMFGAIHGGMVEGNIGISNSESHLFDARINPNLKETFETHTDRIAKKIEPYYQAPHSMSHPATAVVYWQVLRENTNAFVFSAINVCLFSFAFPLIYWALQRRQETTLAAQVTLFCMFIPSYLVYGRSDDAVFYAIAASTMVFTCISIKEKNYQYSALAAFTLAVGLHYSYAALVLFPAVLSFNSEIKLKELWSYLKTILIPSILLALFTLLFLTVYSTATNFNLIEAFSASVNHNSGSNIFSFLDQGKYERILNDRFMAFSDFLIFGGPVFFFLFYGSCKGFNLKFREWKLKNVALSVLLLVLFVNSNGPGEVARPWGMLFVLIALIWVKDLFERESELYVWWAIRLQLIWGLFLQTFLHFSW